MSKRNTTLEQVEASITRWQSRLRRAANALAKLEKQRKRLAAKVSAPKLAKPSLAETIMQETIAPPKPVGEIDTSIPAFLQRKKPDPVAEQIVAEQKDLKRRKAQGRIATMKAKKSGETRKMPLTGKAALAAIRGDAGAESR
jgi:hypothetical protein